MPHHIRQRGNRRQHTIFYGEDYTAYVELMAEGVARVFQTVKSDIVSPEESAMPTIADILLAARAKHRAGRFDEVESLCCEVLAVRPNLAEAHALLAESLVERDAFDEALVHYRQVLCLQPDYVPAHLNLGCMLERSGWIDEAIACYRNGLRIAPNLAQAHQHLGRALCEQHRTDEAIACFERALALKQGWPVARLGRAHAWLMQGDFGRGWDEYECRNAVQSGTWLPCTLPRWDGSRAADKTLLVSAEQGLGTEILFASCIPDMANDV
ncbi:MAG: tetratricopeptide repeat protein, partial [Planctomycetota bacterium]|nr:tetratricopeptide repeat protein [Planctomycetota bacterium]